MQNLMQLMNNPLFKRAMEMGQGKSEIELRQTVLNLAKQKGIAIDQLQQFVSQFGLKL